MTIKKLVNDKPLWDSFLEVINNKIAVAQRRLEQETTMEGMYRAQGEIAKSMDLDPDKVTNSLGDAAIQAEILKKFTTPPEPPAGAVQGPPPPPSPGAAPEQAGVGVADTTGAGGGNIGTGTVPTPGEQGFTGT